MDPKPVTYFCLGPGGRGWLSTSWMPSPPSCSSAMPAAGSGYRNMILQHGNFEEEHDLPKLQIISKLSFHVEFHHEHHLPLPNSPQTLISGFQARFILGRSSTLAIVLTICFAILNGAPIGAVEGGHGQSGISMDFPSEKRTWTFGILKFGRNWCCHENLGQWMLLCQLHWIKGF